MANANGWQNETYNFSPEFQRQIIAAMVQEPKLFDRIGVYIEPTNFEITDYFEIFSTIKQFYTNYGGVPTKEVCVEELRKKYNLNNRDITTIYDAVEEIFDHKRLAVSTIEYIETSVKQFVQCQAVKQAVLDSFKDLGDTSKHLIVIDRLEKAISVCANMEDLGVNVYNMDEIEARWIRRVGNNEIQRYSTGWATFDNIFGGYGCGEIFTFMGPAHSGKSMYLINAGANLILQKTNVLHISLEMSEEITQQRYDMRLLGLSKEELTTGAANPKLKELLLKNLGEIVVKRFPSSTVTAAEISAYIKRLDNVKNFKPDVLIIDYADIMRSSSKYLDKRHELDAIYQELRNIGIEFNIPVITATQLNRSALEKLQNGKTLTEENIAESYGIARIIDCGVTINATPADNAANQSKIYVCKNRDGEAGAEFRMYVDFKKALVREFSAPSYSDIKNTIKKK